jgi:ABC-2 type transport system permease protein
LVGGCRGATTWTGSSPNWAIGLLVSAFARSGFEAVQFMPAFVMSQILLCGLICPREAMAGWLEKISDALPMTYAVDALIQVGRHTDLTTRMWRDVTILVGCIAVALVLASATLRRRAT